MFDLVRERGYEMAWRRNYGFRLRKELFAKGEEKVVGYVLDSSK